MKKAALFFMLAMVSGSILTGCGFSLSTEEKTEISATPKPGKVTKAPEKPVNNKDKNTEPLGNEENNAENTGKDSSETIEQKVESGEITQGWNSIVLYDIHMNEKLVRRGDDGNWYDEDGVSYGDLENVDETQPIVNENGDTYYWNGDYAEQAAKEQEDQETEGENTESQVNDPYDLYSWDEGTESYIPFQEADGDGSPIGRGNGWYYYEEESGEFLPW